uniref:Myosin heavy chain, non-muscle n=1 Tax=Phallusia mammillata TaxID=59560 RepID=A0A6F9DKZ2_9ASCI|nr:myosin heavy chain, non-muscle [Phallusia mammillata]
MLQSSSQPSTSKAMASNSPPNETKMADAIRLIKALKMKITQLQEENKSLRKDLELSTQRYNELVTSETSLRSSQASDLHAPTAENETIKTLTSQVNILQQQLQGKCQISPDEVLQQAEYKTAVEQYRNAIAERDKQLAELQQKCGQPEMAKKISKLQNMLDKARGTIRTFADQIDALKQQLDHLSEESIPAEAMPDDRLEMTQAHAASADDDTNGHHGSSPRLSEHNIDLVARDEHEKVKALNLKLQGDLNEAVTSKETALAELVTIRSEKTELLHENHNLRIENEQLKQQQANQQQGDLYETQMKAFMEDFSLERKEKQALLQQKNEITGENLSLKEHLAQLQSALAKQQHGQMYNQNYKIQPTTPPVYQAVYEHDQVQPFHEHGPTYGMQPHVMSTRAASPPQISRQQSNLVHPQPVMAVEAPQHQAPVVVSAPNSRRIGFPQPVANQPRPRQVPPNPTYLPQQSPPPQQNEGYSYRTQPQVQPYHQRGALQPDGIEMHSQGPDQTPKSPPSPEKQ